MSRKPNPAAGIGKDIRDARESLDWSHVWLQLAAEIAADDGDQPGRRNQPTQWREP